MTENILCPRCSSKVAEAKKKKKKEAFLSDKTLGLERYSIINFIQEPNFEFCSAGCFNLFLL